MINKRYQQIPLQRGDIKAWLYKASTHENDRQNWGITLDDGETAFIIWYPFLIQGGMDRKYKNWRSKPPRRHVFIPESFKKVFQKYVDAFRTMSYDDIAASLDPSISPNSGLQCQK